MKSKIFTGVIYVATCTVNGKQYVGQTSRKYPVMRWNGHIKSALIKGGNTIFYRAIRKYGKEAFVFKIVARGRSPRELGNQETAWIIKLNTLMPYGYNMREGGVNGIFAEGATEVIRAALNRPETKLKLKQRFCLKGADHPRSKLTWEQVREIRASTEPASVIVSRYGATSVTGIRLGHTYKEEGAVYQQKFQAINDRTQISYICTLCKKKFKLNGWRASDPNRGKYCSGVCYHKSRIVRLKINCMYCEKEVWLTPQYAKRNRFCSKKCAAASREGKPRSIDQTQAISAGLLKAYEEGRGPAQIRKTHGPQKKLASQPTL